jgi:hypothetical protein
MKVLLLVIVFTVGVYFFTRSRKPLEDSKPKEGGNGGGAGGGGSFDEDVYPQGPDTNQNLK